jgi:hypothetical protein
MGSFRFQRIPAPLAKHMGAHVRTYIGIFVLHSPALLSVQLVLREPGPRLDMSGHMFLLYVCAHTDGLGIPPTRA